MSIQLGNTGKEGSVFLVREMFGGVELQCVKKVFKKSKSHKMVQKEASYQFHASQVGVAPDVISVDLSTPPSITMYKMDRTIIDVIEEQNGILTEDQQTQILSLYQRLDEIGLLHNDSNPLNIMIGCDGECCSGICPSPVWKLIDYGMSKKITKKHGTCPNVKISLKLMLYSTKGIITRGLLKTPPTILINALE